MHNMMRVAIDSSASIHQICGQLQFGFAGMGQHRSDFSEGATGFGRKGTLPPADRSKPAMMDDLKFLMDKAKAEGR